MRIRTKVLLLFGTLALFPVIITATLDTLLMRSLSQDLTRRSATAMADQALVTMQRIADEYARTLDRERLRMEMLVHLQAESAERLLADDSGKPDSPIYFAEDFDRPDTPIPVERTGPPTSRRQVSWEHQVFQHASTVDRASLIDSAHALAPMGALYRKLRATNDEIIYAHYVVLTNGLTAAWPGRGARTGPADLRLTA